MVDNIVKTSITRLKFLYRFKDMLNFETRKILCLALIQPHFDYSCSSWYPGLIMKLKNKLQITQNKMARFILNVDSRSHIGHEELEKIGILNVPKRVSQMKLGHAYKINNNTCPEYLKTNFEKLNKNENRIATRAKAYNFQVPNIDPNTFAYSTIKDWNSLPNDIKNSKSKQSFKKKVVKHLSEKTN